MASRKNPVDRYKKRAQEILQSEDREAGKNTIMGMSSGMMGALSGPLFVNPAVGTAAALGGIAGLGGTIAGAVKAKRSMDKSAGEIAKKLPKIEKAKAKNAELRKKRGK